MSALVQQRCQYHHDREAVARCPECRRFYCRECVTEHDDRMMCAACLRRISGRAGVTGRAMWRGLGRWGLVVAGGFLAWVWFYLMGKWLLSLPNDFHDGSTWTNML
jgi:hypothetical protein